MQRFLTLLKQIDLDLDPEGIADALWLAGQLDPSPSTASEVDLVPNQTVLRKTDRILPKPIPKPPSSGNATVSVIPPSTDKVPATPRSPELPFQAPTAPALRNALELGRSLRPLMRKVPSRIEQVLDEEATAIAIAESHSQDWQPVLRAAPERWLDLALVVEDTRSTVIWQELIVEVQQLLERQGAFRTVRAWSLRTHSSGDLELFPRSQATQPSRRSRSPKELLNPTGRQLILLLSDCVSPLWRQGKIHALLKVWASTNPTAIVQFLPERLWSRSGLGLGSPVGLRAFVPGVPNSQLEVSDLPVWEESVNWVKSLAFPIVTLEPDSLEQWARVVSGAGNAQTAGILFDLDFDFAQSQTTQKFTPHTPEELVQRFRATASPLAQRLAGLMSVVPVSLPVVHLLQAAMLPASRQVHAAEIFMSGLLQSLPETETVQTAPVRYEFVDRVRDLLQEAVPKTDTLRALDKVSEYIIDRAGLSLRSFAALLKWRSEHGQAMGAEVLHFAELSAKVLRRMGSEYAAWVDELEQSQKPSRVDLGDDPWQTFEYEVVTIAFEEDADSNEDLDIHAFEFDIATVVVEEKRRGGNRVREVGIQRGQAWQFVERLTDEVALEMVAIPAGEFLMGSPIEEPERDDDEGPPHHVTVPKFYLGKYPITQSQWRVVAKLTQIERGLNPDPSQFKGDNRPVENVSWEEVVEFCARLSQLTKRDYRLPSEAEWEYACRARTTTPFHFGETITPDLANYDWDATYAEIKVTRKKDFQGTTPVGQFRVANAFGLCDMHGNVWEWCLDHWHSNYEGAPTDGRAWLSDDKYTNRLLRGGSWNDYPGFCRSDVRNYDSPGDRDLNVGFRVVCSAARILP